MPKKPLTTIGLNLDTEGRKELSHEIDSSLPFTRALVPVQLACSLRTIVCRAVVPAPQDARWFLERQEIRWHARPSIIPQHRCRLRAGERAYRRAPQRRRYDFGVSP